MTSRAGKLKIFTLRVISQRSRRGRLTFGTLSWPCSLGRTGSRTLKWEGDGATPVGRWRLLRVHYRADRVIRPLTGHPVTPVRRHDGWCDAPCDRNYNRRVTHPYPASAEELWREDHLYDIIVVLDHNTRPRRRYGGSAVFIHLERPDLGPTAGCIALKERDLRQILRLATGPTLIQVPG